MKTSSFHGKFDASVMCIMVSLINSQNFVTGTCQKLIEQEMVKSVW